MSRRLTAIKGGTTATNHRDRSRNYVLGMASPILTQNPYFRVKLSTLRHAGKDPAYMEGLLRKRLRRVLHDASRTSYWSHIPQQWTPDVFDILENFPVIGKRELTRHRSEMTTSPNFMLDLVATSGSSGTPTSFYLPKVRPFTEWVYVAHAWAPAEYSLGEWRVVLRGFNFSNGDAIHVNHLTREIRVSATRLDENVVSDVLTLMRDLNARHLHGYPSALTRFAREIRAMRPAHHPKVLGIFPVSEAVTDGMMQSIRDVFPEATVVPFYGLSEKCAFATSIDSDAKAYRLEPLYGLVQVLDSNNRPVSVGERGRIVATRMEFRGASLIRYDTGDEAVLTKSLGSDNRIALELAEISPRRSPAYLISSAGTEVPISAGLQLPSGLYTQIHEYQFRQTAPGLLRILVVCDTRGNSELLASVRSAFSSKLGPDFRVEVEKVESIPSGPNGKKPLVVLEGTLRAGGDGLVT